MATYSNPGHWEPEEEHDLSRGPVPRYEHVAQDEPQISTKSPVAENMTKLASEEECMLTEVKKVDLETGEVDESNENTQRRVRYRPSKRTIFKLWLFEIVATVAAIAFMIAIYCLLIDYDGKRTSAWKPSINLTTMVATLSTIARIALAMVVSEIISQTKWSTFWSHESNPRTQGVPLEEMELYDQASRGSTGSMMLVKRSLRKPALLLSLGVMLFSVAMGPFAQQAVRTVECKYIDESAAAVIPSIQTLGALNNYSRSYRNFGDAENLLNFASKAGVISSLTDPSAEDSAIQATCTTANCTFPIIHETGGDAATHRAVGFCSQCIDTSSYIRYKKEYRESFYPLSNTTSSWFLPNGQVLANSHTMHREGRGMVYDTSDSFLSVSSEVIQFEDSGDGYLGPLGYLEQSHADAPGFFNTSYSAFLNVSFLARDQSAFKTSSSDEQEDALHGVTATACTVFPCLKSYHATYERGKMVEKLILSERMTPYGDLVGDSDPAGFVDGLITVYPSDSITVRTPCFVESQLYTDKNISMAPGAITLSRRNIDPGRRPFVDSHFGIHSPDAPGMPPEINITAPPECIYAVNHYEWLKQLGDFLETALSGECGEWSTRIAKPPCVSFDDDGSYTDEKFWLEGLGHRPDKTTAGVTLYMDEFTESLTRRFRQGFGNYSTLETWPVGRVKGDAWQTTTCFAVEWPWLILPSILTVIGAVLLIWTLTKHLCGWSRGEMTWKSSILPLLFHEERFVSFDDRESDMPRDEQEEWTPLMALADMRKRSKNMKVVFQG